MKTYIRLTFIIHLLVAISLISFNRQTEMHLSFLERTSLSINSNLLIFTDQINAYPI